MSHHWDHSFSRGGPVAIWDAQVRELLGRLDEVVDASSALSVWEAALEVPHESAGVWVHGDVTGSNLLVRDGHLVGVIDFGCSAVGDPACDLTVAWTMFDGENRRLFQELVPVEESAWARARGWALWKALIHLDSEASSPGRSRRRDRRAGWRNSAAQIVDELASEVAGRGDRSAAALGLGGRGEVEDGSPRLVLQEPSAAIDVRPFEDAHLAGMLRLCEAEGWRSLPSDPERAKRVLTAPGVTTVVSYEGDEVTGFAQMLSDGEIQAFLACLVVAESHRDQGIGPALVREALRAAGGERIDLLSEPGAVLFYESFPHQRKPGFRLYPFYR